MFGYRSNVPKVRLTTDRLVVRLVHDRDAWRLADYYAENRHFLKPWEPVRDESHCYPSGWQARHHDHAPDARPVGLWLSALLARY
ncbi:hypothetical protein ACUODJ_33385, partial [Escherichia sp. HC-CC]